MGEVSERQWVWWSNEASRAEGKLSILAVFETLFCVAIYWLLFLWLGVTWHHWLILIATPLVLMRSEPSIVRGAEWFDEFVAGERHRSPVRLVHIEYVLFFVLVTALSLVAGYLAAWLWLSEVDYGFFSWRACFIGFIICLAIGVLYVAFPEVQPTVSDKGQILFISSAAMASAVGGAAVGGVSIGGAIFIGAAAFLGAGLLTDELTKRHPHSLIAISISILTTPMLISAAFGFLTRAICTRFLATFCHPVAGFISIPSNWRQTMLSADLFQAPELVPGHSETRLDAFLRGSLKNVPAGRNYGALDYPVPLATSALVFYGPALIWRWTLKSTAWFYLPLLWLGRGWVWDRDTELAVWGKTYVLKLWNKVSLAVAVIFLVLALLPLIGWGELVGLAQDARNSGAPWSPLLVIFVLDWSVLSAQPWHWFYLPSWTLTIFLFFAIDGIRWEMKEGGDLAPRLRLLERYKWLSNLRVVLTNIGLAIALIYVLQVLGAWEQLESVFSG